MQVTIARNDKLATKESKELGYDFYTVWSTSYPCFIPVGTSATLPLLRAMYPEAQFYVLNQLKSSEFDPNMDTLPTLTIDDLRAIRDQK